jgi:hypothetical protein
VSDTPDVWREASHIREPTHLSDTPECFGAANRLTLFPEIRQQSKGTGASSDCKEVVSKKFKNLNKPEFAWPGKLEKTREKMRFCRKGHSHGAVFDGVLESRAGASKKTKTKAICGVGNRGEMRFRCNQKCGGGPLWVRILGGWGLIVDFVDL